MALLETHVDHIPLDTQAAHDWVTVDQLADLLGHHGIAVADVTLRGIEITLSGSRPGAPLLMNVTYFARDPLGERIPDPHHVGAWVTETRGFPMLGLPLLGM